VGTGVAAVLELGELVEELFSADPQPANPTTSTPTATAVTKRCDVNVHLLFRLIPLVSRGGRR